MVPLGKEKRKSHLYKILQGAHAQSTSSSAEVEDGDLTVSYPPGLYPPSMPKLADVLGY